MPQKIIAIACARNEADIIEAFVRHTLTFVDSMVIVNHGSIDSTPEILALLQKEGLPIEVRDMGCVAQMQAEILTSLVRELAASQQPDWVVPLDVDEFLIAPEGTVRAAIESLPTELASTVRMRPYVPDSNKNSHVLKRVRRRVNYDAFPFLKVIAIPNGLCGERGQLTPGNHGYLWDNLPMLQWNESLVMAHIPFRSPLQAQGKALGWINHLARENALQEEAIHWKALFGDFLHEKLCNWQQVAAWAMHYARYIAPDCPLDLVVDPLPSMPLRYSALAVYKDPRLILENLAHKCDIAIHPAMTTAQLAEAVEACVLKKKGQKPC